MVTSWHGWTIGFRHKQDTGKDLGRAHGSSQIRIQVVEERAKVFPRPGFLLRESVANILIAL